MANADACVNFACERPNFADVGGGGGKKWQNFVEVLYGLPLNDLTWASHDSFSSIKTTRNLILEIRSLSMYHIIIGEVISLPLSVALFAVLLNT